jgi:oligopeptide transport system permease protein
VPSPDFWFGTDKFGRDMWARVWAGTRVSLYIGFLAAFLDLFVGVTFGAVSGYLGGWVDDVMQRGIEILNGLPSLVVAILAMIVLKPGIITITIALGITGRMFMVRIVRGRMMQLKEQEFALASRSLGASGPRLVWKHLIPNSMGPIIVNLTFTIPDAIFGEAFLSFIGLGIQVPGASLGPATCASTPTCCGSPRWCSACLWSASTCWETACATPSTPGCASRRLW